MLKASPLTYLFLGSRLTLPTCQIMATRHTVEYTISRDSVKLKNCPLVAANNSSRKYLLELST